MVKFMKGALLRVIDLSIPSLLEWLIIPSLMKIPGLSSGLKN